MPLREILQVRLPRAIAIESTNVASRQWDLTIYPNNTNYYTHLKIPRIRGAPNFVPFQVWVFQNDMELGQYAAANGEIVFDVEVTDSQPVLLRLFNLSIDTDVMLSIHIEGDLYYAV